MEHKSFKAKDKKGKTYTINCSRPYDKRTNTFGLWDCYTDDGRPITPTDFNNGEFDIVDVQPVAIKSIGPNPLK